MKMDLKKAIVAVLTERGGKCNVGTLGHHLELMEVVEPLPDQLSPTPQMDKRDHEWWGVILDAIGHLVHQGKVQRVNREGSLIALTEVKGVNNDQQRSGNECSQGEHPVPYQAHEGG